MGGWVGAWLPSPNSASVTYSGGGGGAAGNSQTGPFFYGSGGSGGGANGGPVGNPGTDGLGGGAGGGAGTTPPAGPPAYANKVGGSGIVVTRETDSVYVSSGVWSMDDVVFYRKAQTWAD